MLPPKPSEQERWQAAVTLKPPKPPPNDTQHTSPPEQFWLLPQLSEMPGPQGVSIGVHELDGGPARPPENWMQHCWVSASHVSAPHGIVPSPPAPLDEPEPLLDEPPPLLLLLLLPPPLEELEPLLPWPPPLDELETLPLEEEPVLPPEELELPPSTPLLEELEAAPPDEPEPLPEDPELLFPWPPLLDELPCIPPLEELAPPLLPPLEELGPPLLPEAPLLPKPPLEALEIAPLLDDPAASGPPPPSRCVVSSRTRSPSNVDRPQPTPIKTPTSGSAASHRTQYAIFLQYQRFMPPTTSLFLLLIRQVTQRS